MESPFSDDLSERRDAYDELARELADIKMTMRDLLTMIRGQTKNHYSIAEVARAVDRSEYTVRSWIKHGLLRAVRVDGTGPRGRLLVPRDELQRIVRGGRGSALPANVVSSRESANA